MPRRYSNRESRPIPVWNGLLEPKHRSRIDSAVWTYLWCLDRITREEGAFGVVKGGAPVKAAQIGAELGISDRTVRRDLKRLAGDYLDLTRTPYGFRIRVLNSRKFGVWRSATGGRSAVERPAITGRSDGERPAMDVRSRSARNGRNKEDTAVVKTAVKAAADRAAWEAIELEPLGPLAFRRHWEGCYQTRNGSKLSELMGSCADSWQAAGGTVPGPFFAKLKEIRLRERIPAPASEPEYARL